MQTSMWLKSFEMLFVTLAKLTSVVLRIATTACANLGEDATASAKTR
nr:hypothetical protein [Sphingopyxis sp. PET50]